LRKPGRQLKGNACLLFLAGAGQPALGAAAAGAQLEPGNLAVYHDFGRMDIGRPLAVGAPFGMGYVMSKLNIFAAKFTLHGLNNSFDGCVVLV